MTDIAPVTEDAPVADTAPVSEAPVTEAPDAFEDESVQTFDRKYVQKLREENAKHRTAAAAAKKYEEAFGSYSDEERAVWMELATGLTTDAAGTAKRFQEIAKAILGDDDATPEATAAAEAVLDDDTPLTKAQVQELLAERDKTADLEQRVATIKSTATELGYKEGTVAYRSLLITAQENDGDIAKAHTILEAEKQSHIDAYLAAKAADATGSPTPAGAAATGGQERKARTFSEAGDALREMLAARQA